MLSLQLIYDYNVTMSTPITNIIQCVSKDLEQSSMKYTFAPIAGNQEILGFEALPLQLLRLLIVVEIGQVTIKSGCPALPFPTV